MIEDREVPNVERALERVRASQVGVCQQLAGKIADLVEQDRAAVISIGEELEQEQDVLYAIDAALRSAGTKLVA